MLGSSIKRVLDEQGITYKSSEWKILKYKPPNIWLEQYYKTKTLEEKSIETLEEKSIKFFDVSAYLRNNVFGKYSDLPSQLYLEHPEDKPLWAIYLESDLYNALIANVLDPESFSQELQTKFFKNNLKLSYEDYLLLYKQAGGKRSTNDITQVLEQWAIGGNYSKAVKWGQMLDKAVHFLPPEALGLPDQAIKLYRGVHVDETAFQKLLEKDKPLILKNRKYSSWSADFNVAKSFASFPSQNKVGVVIKRTFPKKDLLLNVQQLAKYLRIKDKVDSDENEVIVKNGNKDYKFTLKDIALFQRKWHIWEKP